MWLKNEHINRLLPPKLTWSVAIFRNVKEKILVILVISRSCVSAHNDDTGPQLGNN